MLGAGCAGCVAAGVRHGRCGGGGARELKVVAGIGVQQHSDGVGEGRRGKGCGRAREYRGKRGTVGGGGGGGAIDRLSQ